MKNQEIKILHIMSSFGGGISSFIRNKVESVDSSKVIFDVATFNDYTEDFSLEISQQGGRIFRIPNPKKEGVLHYLRTYRSILKNNGPYDIVHCHIGGYRGFVFYLLSKLEGVKRFIIHAHSSQPYYSKGMPVRAQLLSSFERFLNQHASDQKLSCGVNASRYHFGESAVNKKEVLHIPNSIDLDKYMKSYSTEEIKELKKRNGIPEGRTIIGHVGRFDENKNHRFMLDLVEVLRDSGYSFTWLFIGTGKLYDDIKKETQIRQIENNVRLLGRREDVEDLYPLMDVFVLPSYSEGLPTVCVESQAAGVPCVISDTITQEVDMKLGMAQFISLQAPMSTWVDAIKTAASTAVPDQQTIRRQINVNKFSNEASGKLYEDFIFNKVSHYEI